MNKIKQNIPNAITCGNLFCGCLALVEAYGGDWVQVAFFVGMAAILDFFDGFAARLLHVSSPIGKDLDSLADMVTFGVVPGMVMFKIIQSTMNFYHAIHLEYIAFIIPIFSAVRLARFNNDTRQTTSFIGLPTPANAILICSLPLAYNAFFDGGTPLRQCSFCSTELSIIISCISAFLLITPIPMFALKFKSFGFKGNEIRYVFLWLSLFLLLTLKFVGIPLIIVLYILMSMGNNLFYKAKEKP